VAKGIADTACLLRHEHAAAAQVVTRLYDDGQLGTKAALRRRFAGIPTSDYLDANGKLLPYNRLRGPAKERFEAWRLSVEHSDRWGSKVQDAESKAADGASDSCDNSS
jgi:hypothetical protein